MNTKFATVDSSNRIVYAPDTLGASLRAPKDWQYHKAGYWEIDKTVPTAPDGKYAKPIVIDGYKIGDLVTVQEEHIPAVNDEGEQLDPADEYRPLVKVVRRRYEFADIPEEVRPPRVFSKLYLLVALGKRDLYGKFLDYLGASGFEPMWNAAQDLSEDYEGFNGIVEQFKAALGLTDEQVGEILDEAVMR